MLASPCSNNNNNNNRRGIVIVVLFAFYSAFLPTVLNAAKRPSYHTTSTYKLQSSSALFPRTSIDENLQHNDLPFVDTATVEYYLGYRERKEATIPKVLPQESQLKNDLLFNDVYDRTSRPVIDDHIPLVVKAGISLYHVLDLDEKLQLLSMVVAIRLSWFDEYLQWEIASYSNISSILLPSSLIWLPDVVVLNNAEVFQQKRHETNVIVSNDGFVLWMFPSLIKTFCYLDLSWFPFDEQNCDVLMSSLTYDIRQMNFTTSASNNASYYDESGQEWTVVSIIPNRFEVFEPLSYRKMAQINFRITLKRKPLFYMYTCVFPCFLIYFVCLLSFFVPVSNDQGGKIELPLTSLLSIVVLQMTVADSLAASDIVPLISKMYAWTMVQCVLSVVFSVAVTVVAKHNKDGSENKPIPGSVKYSLFPELLIKAALKHIFGGRTNKRTNNNNRLLVSDYGAKKDQKMSPSSSLNMMSTSSSTSGSHSPISSPLISSSTSLLLSANKNSYASIKTTTTPLSAGAPGGECRGGRYWPLGRLFTTNNNNNDSDESSWSLPSISYDESNTTWSARMGDFFLLTKDAQVLTPWERAASRLNVIFLFLFLILTLLGYGLCLPSVSSSIF